MRGSVYLTLLAYELKDKSFSNQLVWDTGGTKLVVISTCLIYVEVCKTGSLATNACTCSSLRLWLHAEMAYSLLWHRPIMSHTHWLYWWEKGWVSEKSTRNEKEWKKAHVSLSLRHDCREAKNLRKCEQRIKMFYIRLLSSWKNELLKPEIL